MGAAVNNDDDMPPLPEPDRTMWQHGQRIDHYTKAQMLAFAQAALDRLADQADAEIGRMIAAGLGQIKQD